MPSRDNEREDDEMLSLGSQFRDLLVKTKQTGKGVPTNFQIT